MIKVQDKLNIFDNLPGEIESILLEKEFKLQLTYISKLYYILRPVIPMALRRLIQKNRNVQVEKNWYISDKLISTYLKYCSEEKFNDVISKLWGEKIISPLILTHDVESFEGLKYIPKVIELEEKYEFKSSFNIVPYLYDIPDEIINLIKLKGYEIGIHGYNHDGKDYFSRSIFNKRVKYINNAIEKYGAVGYRSPLVHRNLEWLQDLNILYDSSCFDIDPFQMMPGGTHCIWPFKAGKFIELPYTLPQDHVLWIQLGEKNNDIWKKKTDWLMKYNGIILMLTHPDYLMLEDNIKLYEEFLAYLKTLNGVKNYLPKDLCLSYYN